MSSTYSKNSDFISRLRRNFTVPFSDNQAYCQMAANQAQLDAKTNTADAEGIN